MARSKFSFPGSSAVRLTYPPARHACTLLLLTLLPLVVTGCSVKKFAINKLGDSLANSGTTFASDDDPDLVGQALPFSLKLMDGLLAESPTHRGLLFAASSGFTEYAYAYVQQDADTIENQDFAKATALRIRARHLYLRARDYGLRGLEVKHPGFEQSLRRDSRAAVHSATARDVPLLYWTAVSWGAAISLSKDSPDLVADQPIVEALIDRAFELNPNFDSGAIHGFLITYESARQGAGGDFASRSRSHFEAEVELTGGQLAAPYVALAETVSVSKQNRAEFESLLHRALAVDPDRRLEWRLNNLITQRRARWLLARENEFFADDRTGGEGR